LLAHPAPQIGDERRAELQSLGAQHIALEALEQGRLRRREEAAAEKHAAQLQHDMLVTGTKRSALLITNGGGTWVEIRNSQRTIGGGAVGWANNWRTQRVIEFVAGNLGPLGQLLATIDVSARTITSNQTRSLSRRF
jgi:hypothetical protein